MGKEEEVRLFDFDSYRDYLLAVSEREGRGFFQELAAYLRVHSSLISQIVRGPKNPTEEQACSIAEKLALNDAETEYLLMLVLKDRAGNQALRKFAMAKIKTLQLQASKPSARLKSETTLTHADKTEFYSHWYYSAIRLMSRNLNAIWNRGEAASQNQRFKKGIDLMRLCF